MDLEFQNCIHLNVHDNICTNCGLCMVSSCQSIDFNDNYAPTIISRQGVEEPIELLSLGTQEQISIFVRLAFAKLFSNTHSSIPVIIDDAIIYSDDNRIKEIFTALHMQSQNYQIIVFSCRQKSFEELGGNLLSLEPVN